MKIWSIAFAVAAAVTGIIAAVLWWRSTLPDQRFISAPPLGDVADDTADKSVLKGWLGDIYGHLYKTSDASKIIGGRNKWAAIYTGISVACSGISSVLGTL